LVTIFVRGHLLPPTGNCTQEKYRERQLDVKEMNEEVTTLGAKLAETEKVSSFWKEKGERVTVLTAEVSKLKVGVSVSSCGVSCESVCCEL